MKFTKLYKLLKEDFYFSFDYIIPTEKEKLIYDFYMLNYISNCFNQSIYSEDKEKEDIALSIKDTEDKLLNFLKEELLGAVLYSICCEVRHISDDVCRDSSKQQIKKIKDAGYLQEFIKYIRLYVGYSEIIIPSGDYGNYNFSKELEYSEKEKEYTNLKNNRSTHRERLASYKAFLDSNIDRAKFVEMCFVCFDKFDWGGKYESGFGGKAWANICSAWLRLNETKTKNEMFIWIDHIYDLQHNNNYVLDKVKSYYKTSGNMKWLKNVLDFKAKVKNPWFLLKNCSSDMINLGAKTLKLCGFGTWDEFIQFKKEETKQIKEKPKKN